jgi:hypothetical protein
LSNQDGSLVVLFQKNKGNLSIHVFDIEQEKEICELQEGHSANCDLAVLSQDGAHIIVPNKVNNV